MDYSAELPAAQLAPQWHRNAAYEQQLMLSHTGLLRGPSGVSPDFRSHAKSDDVGQDEMG
jgi:hypothetical protein